LGVERWESKHLAASHHVVEDVAFGSHLLVPRYHLPLVRGRAIELYVSSIMLVIWTTTT
jgi:hypothetical protein